MFTKINCYWTELMSQQDMFCSFNLNVEAGKHQTEKTNEVLLLSKKIKSIWRKGVTVLFNSKIDPTLDLAYLR